MQPVETAALSPSFYYLSISQVVEHEIKQDFVWLATETASSCNNQINFLIFSVHALYKLITGHYPRIQLQIAFPRFHFLF